MAVPDLIRSSGYKEETQLVETEDGYLLELHRIPSDGKALLLMHGMLCSSYCWVTSGENSLAFLLADLGYDVWLGNFRGTNYSRHHVTLDPDQDRGFWRFTLHELGTRDLPAIISRILTVTGKSKLSFIGHSMSTTCFLILASSSEYQKVTEQVDLAILMAPVVEPHNMRNLISKLSPLHRLYRWLMETLGILEILPSTFLIEKLTWDHILQPCLKHNLRGPDPTKEDRQLLNRICQHGRTSKTSFYTVLHYAQNISNRTFQAFDWYDDRENRQRYGTDKPPKYDLHKVSVPVALFWSPQDSLSSKQDMKRIVEELPHLVSCKEVNIGHLEYLWGSHVREKLYQDLVDLLGQASVKEYVSRSSSVSSGVTRYLGASKASVNQDRRV